jgi:hypothetical protein
VFELTNDIHGDVEWFYVLSFPTHGYIHGPGVACVERSLDHEAGEVYARITGPFGTVSDLVERVNADRRGINRRIDGERYEMVTA